MMVAEPTQARLDLVAELLRGTPYESQAAREAFVGDKGRQDGSGKPGDGSGKPGESQGGKGGKGRQGRQRRQGMAARERQRAARAASGKGPQGKRQRERQARYRQKRYGKGRKGNGKGNGKRSLVSASPRAAEAEPSAEASPLDELFPALSRSRNQPPAEPSTSSSQPPERFWDAWKASVNYRMNTLRIFCLEQRLRHSAENKLSDDCAFWAE